MEKEKLICKEKIATDFNGGKELLQNLGFDFEFDIEEISEDEDYSHKNKEIDTDDYEDIMELKFKLTFSEYEKAREKLKEIANSPENALKILLKMEI